VQLNSLQKIFIYENMPFFLSISLFCSSSCNTTDAESANDTYYAAIDKIKYSCTESVNENSFEATIKSTKTCYYGGEDRKITFLSVASIFTTSGPVLSSSDTLTQSKSIIMGIVSNGNVQDEEYIEFTLPKFGVDVDPATYLDSFLLQKEIKVRSIKDEPNSMLIELVIQDLLPLGGSSLYIISSSTGEQEGSELKVTRFEKTIENGDVYYNLEIHVDCKLYYKPTLLGTGGFYSKLENGVLRLKAKLAP
jgi:hypothetical protein